ncbi:hypothetical protein HBH58_029670 [Parastagonospora nodorum]|nr:hypothetical protein HBH58_029670 [Parastagonospora nodorum]
MQRLSMSCIVASSPDTMSRIDMPLVSNERTPTAFTGPQTPQGLSSTNIPPPPPTTGGTHFFLRALLRGGAVAGVALGAGIQAGLECNAADLHYLDWTDEDSRNAVKFR